MFDLIKKAMLTGVGLASLTKDKIEELAKDLSEKIKLSEEDGEKLLDELLNKSEEAKSNLQASIENTVNDIVKKMHLVTRKEFGDLKDEIDQLKQKIGDSPE